MSAAKAEGKQKSQINTSELFNFPSLPPTRFLSPSLIELCILAQCENALSRLFYVFILFFIFVFISFWERVICKRSTGLSQSSPNVVPSSSSSAFTSLCCKNCVVYITKVFYNLFSLRSHFLFGFFFVFFLLFIHLKFDFYLTCWQAKGIQMANEWPAQLSLDKLAFECAKINLNQNRNQNQRWNHNLPFVRAAAAASTVKDDWEKTFAATFCSLREEREKGKPKKQWGGNIYELSHMKN